MGEIITEYFDCCKNWGQSQNSVISYKLCFIDKSGLKLKQYKYTSIEV